MSGVRKGVTVSGATSHGRCQVGMSGRMVSITSYEVLTQVQAASRVEWRTFHRFSTLPQGAVAGVDGAADWCRCVTSSASISLDGAMLLM